MGVFNPVHRYVNRIYFNYRDHRKIAVIDGYVATAAIIADEYANLIVRFGHWKDSAVRIEGEGAWASPPSSSRCGRWWAGRCPMRTTDDPPAGGAGLRWILPAVHRWAAEQS